MQKLTIAMLVLLPLAACGEDPMPPKRTAAPEAAKPKPAVKAPEQAEAPKPPPPAPEDKKPEAPAAAVNKALLDPSLPEWVGKAPDTFKVKFTTSKGDFVIEVTRAWSPRGADRFHALVKNGYYDDVVFFRVVAGFMAQFGIHGAPEVNAAWRNATIQDDPVTQSNKRGMVSYAMRGPNSRTVQLF
ncbi:MAG: peptidylprolyl isomerase, partial [Planctomycetaceae bacterium]|nr:peptidylprolyl isomerase [Planctomycetaceae bacterium]